MKNEKNDENDEICKILKICENVENSGKYRKSGKCWKSQNNPENIENPKFKYYIFYYTLSWKTPPGGKFLKSEKNLKNVSKIKKKKQIDGIQTFSKTFFRLFVGIWGKIHNCYTKSLSNLNEGLLNSSLDRPDWCITTKSKCIQSWELCQCSCVCVVYFQLNLQQMSCSSINFIVDSCGHRIIIR